MADKLLKKKLDEQLRCAICREIYTNPKVLQCFHVYCQQCLIALVARDRQGHRKIACPTCCRSTPIPDAGLAALQPAFHINHLLENQRPTTTCPAQFCPNHPDEELKLYCETCKESICLKCAIRGGDHHSHKYDDLKENLEKCKQEVASKLEPMKEHVKDMTKALEQLDKRCGEISNQRGSIAHSIRVNFMRLRKLLDIRETTLVGQLDLVIQSKLKRLAVQRKEIENVIAQFNSYLQYVGESLKTSNMREVKMSVVQQIVKALTARLQPDAFRPIAQADIEFIGSEKLTSYGQLVALGSPDPSKCHAAGKGINSASVGETSAFTLNLEDSQCKEPTKMLECLECELVSQITGAKLVHMEAEKRRPSLYEIKYVPNIKGRHQLHVSIEGQHIRGSPFSIVVKAPVEKIGTPILSMDGVTRPVGIAINQKGDLAVAGAGRRSIFTFSPNGSDLLELSWCGSGQGECLSPQGLAFDEEGNIFVADSGNHRIQKFTSKGQFLASVGTMGSGPLQFLNPTNIAFNASNKRLYVVDSGNHRVQVLNFNLSFYESFGRIGSSKGQFSEPCGIACDSTGKVYVADSGNHRIQVFTAEGEFLRMFGRCGQGRGDLNLPYYIAIGSGESDTVYISETGNHRVSVFTSEGQFVTSFGRRGEGAGEFDFPCGLAVDEGGVVYVCDGENNRIQAF